MGKDNTKVQLEQEKKLKEIGACLHRIRTEQGLTLETIATKTMISVRLLQAIEAGKQEELPEPFYTQALIKKYALALNATNLELIQPTTSPTKRRSTRISLPRLSFPSFQLRPAHLYILYILLVGISVKGITSFVERPIIQSKPSEIDAISSVESSINISNPVRPEQPLTPVPQLVSQSHQNQTLAVDISLKDRCWLKVMVDGNTQFEGILPQGSRRTWVGNEQITIRAGNAGGVVVTLNNGQEKILGQPGQVQEVTYTVN
jgi:cytoskeletal protein RodZ